MALCTRCGGEAAEWSRLCPSCRQSYRHLLRGSAGHVAAPGQRGPHRLPLIPVAGLAASLPLARALAAWPRRTLRYRHLLPGGAGERSPRWSVTAAAFVGLVVAAVAATLCLAELGSPASDTSTAVSPASTTESVATHALAPPATGLVTVSAAARSAPHAPAVSRFVSRYFAAVSGHDYPAYRMMLADVARQRQSLHSFDARYGATSVSGVTLISITAVSPGRADVSVKFASRQADAAASACAHWLVLLRLVKRHGGYLLSSAASTKVSSGAGCG